MAQKTATYYDTAKVKCSNCNSEYTLFSSVESMTVEVCGNCHPFYTGQDVVMDTAGRIEKFQARLAKVQDIAGRTKKIKARKLRQTLEDLETPDMIEVIPQAESEKMTPRHKKTDDAPAPKVVSD
jgi:large subunit ribosomal protein L31